MIVGIGSPCRRPISKSLGSCAGVILSAPVPNAGSTCSSATTGIMRPTSGSSICLPMRCAVALVIGVDGDGRVAQHRLDPRGGDDDAVLPVAVADGDQLAVDVLVLDLDVGQHAAHLGRPVDHPLRAVDQPVVVEALEHGEDGPVAALVHREALAAPVDAVAEAAHLGQDRAAVLGLPLPGAVDERRAAQLAAVGALGRQRALDERVDRDRGVVHARQPQGVVALHAAAADQDVDQRVLEGVADVQAAGDVGRRDDDAERRLVRRVVGGEVARFDPPVVHARLYSARRPLGRELGGARWEGFGHPSSLRGATDSIFRTAGARRRAGRTRAIQRACCAARGRAAPPGPRRWWARRHARRRRSPTARGSSGAGWPTPRAAAPAAHRQGGVRRLDGGGEVGGVAVVDQPHAVRPRPGRMPAQPRHHPPRRGAQRLRPELRGLLVHLALPRVVAAAEPDRHPGRGDRGALAVELPRLGGIGPRGERDEHGAAARGAVDLVELGAAAGLQAEPVVDQRRAPARQRPHRGHLRHRAAALAAAEQHLRPPAPAEQRPHDTGSCHQPATPKRIEPSNNASAIHDGDA